MKKRYFAKFLAIVGALIVAMCSFACAPSQNPSSSNLGEIKNIILIIGDGMGIEHVTAGQLYEEKEYGFGKWKYVSVNTDSVDTIGNSFITTDSAAGGTALASGQLTVNGYVGKEWHGRDVYTIMDYAIAQGKATGVVSTDNIYGATPASFSGHAMNRGDTADIVTSQFSSGIDLLCAHVSSECTDRADEIANGGYTLCTDFEDIENAKKAEKAYWQFNMAGHNAPVKLNEVASHAIDYLSSDEDGFVLMIEQAHIDKYSHNSDFEGMVKSVASLNDTVETVLDWIGNRTDTAVLITADHETGGLTVSTCEQSYSSYKSKNGNEIYYAWEHGNHTDSKVGLFVYGINPDYSDFSYYKSNHLIKNINVFDIMNKLLYNGSAYAN